VVGLAIPLSATKFARGFEAEADYLGVEYMYKAGYDPQALISFFERVQAEERQKPGFVAKAFSTHPQTSDRIRKSQREIDGILPPRETYVLSTSEFSDVKSLLANFHSNQASEPGANRPILQRTHAEEGDSAGDNERPTLKRRDN
jgi:predicted Zn-dependent protease